METAKKKLASPSKTLETYASSQRKRVLGQKKESLEDFKCNLKRIKTDKLDVIQLHGIDGEKTLSKAMSADGSPQTCKEARKEGLVDFIGITEHKPRVLVRQLRVASLILFWFLLIL